MRPIRAQLYTGWNEWLKPDGSEPEMDRGQRGIAAGYGWWEMDRARRWIAAWYGSRLDMNEWPRWMTGDRWQEMGLRRWITEDGWKSVSFPIWSYEVTIERGFEDIVCSSGMPPPSMIPSTTHRTIPGTIQRYRIIQVHARVPVPNTIPNQIPSYSYNADTALALRGQSLVKQRSLKKGMTVPE